MACRSALYHLTCSPRGSLTIESFGNSIVDHVCSTWASTYAVFRILKAITGCGALGSELIVAKAMLTCSPGELSPIALLDVFTTQDDIYSRIIRPKCLG